MKTSDYKSLELVSESSLHTYVDSDVSAVHCSGARGATCLEELYGFVLVTLQYIP